MAFFDLHCHPFFKPTWTIPPVDGDQKQLLTDNLTFEIKRGSIRDIGTLLLSVFGKGLVSLLNSQASLKQIRQGEGIIIVSSMVAMENAYANLDFCVFKRVFTKLKNINEGLLGQVSDNIISYADALVFEETLTQRFADTDLNGMRYKRINTFAEADLSGRVINIIASVEGGHCFYQNHDINEQERNPDDVVNALIAWKQNPAKPRLLYITVTHHTTNCLTNHAFAVPTLLAGNGTNPKAGGFNPTGNGLTPAGRNFIRAAVRTTPTERRVLIDVKHLSLQARMAFYDLRRQLMDAGHEPFPIIASHIGVTGLQITDAVLANCHEFEQDMACLEVEYIETEQLRGFRIVTDAARTTKDLRFNPWTVNLFDEEIREIVASGGLIGFSFDSRILGNETLDAERFSRHEVGVHGRNPRLQSIVVADFNPANQPIVESRYPEQPILSLAGMSESEQKKHTDLLALCQNVVHTVRVGGPDAWNCICIGSDFDGIINSIDFAPDASAVPGMKNQFLAYLVTMVLALNPFLTTRGEAPIVIPDDAFERFLLTNATRFLTEHFV
jgi:microsomal dipeptidase-like Zn-dependent dipeptidase